ncbi:hypothetical protein NN3_13170 [Nocardia neocaledoniensis NBRC 108232]|uniref:hypothetical protein n=1 Tax=Nocardia neocaledoniensis TaxID=236511 RepID=UPI00119065DB|nr:hypothetical protein [Nocardia neocaledoniensis]GEM30310.1 hypothetical protein NN3_13170 [Nocardia neocaledoniensis NBRC 108232]
MDEVDEFSADGIVDATGEAATHGGVGEVHERADRGLEGVSSCRDIQIWLSPRVTTWMGLVLFSLTRLPPGR